MAQKCCIRASVRVYLHQIVAEHTDPYTGQANYTAMAEDAAWKFDIDGDPPEYVIPEWVYEYALEVAEKHEEGGQTQCS